MDIINEKINEAKAKAERLNAAYRAMNENEQTVFNEAFARINNLFAQREKDIEAINKNTTAIARSGLAIAAVASAAILSVAYLAIRMWNEHNEDAE